jgi:diguanylate cyclase (GGDEF)-like protein
MRCRTVPYDDGAAIFMRTASEDDVTEHLRSESSVTDTLTGLRNKAGLGEDVSALITKRAPFHLLIIGIEGLKTVNDSHGYDIVDMCLLELTAQLKASLDPGDSLYRIATDELGAICFGSEDEAFDQLTHSAAVSADSAYGFRGFGRRP